MKKLESWRGAIIVIFKPDVSQARRKQIVSEQKCRFQDGFDGKDRVNVIVVKPGEDEAMVRRFAALTEVEKALLNDDGITLEG